LGLPEAGDRPVIPAPAPVVDKVASWRKQSSAGRYVLVHAGSSPRWLSKRWAPERFAELAELLIKDGITVVWIGADDEIDLNAALAAKTGIDATDLFSLQELVELGRGAEFALVSDSGPMHLLSASGIPVYAFFGPTDFNRSHAIGQRNNVLSSNADCSPCFLPVCPAEKGHKCLNDISVGDVYNRLKADKCI
jgi:ADP-heptose:LPS heptosyltransferase